MIEQQPADLAMSDRSARTGPVPQPFCGQDVRMPHLSPTFAAFSECDHSATDDPNRQAVQNHGRNGPGKAVFRQANSQGSAKHSEGFDDYDHHDDATYLPYALRVLGVHSLQEPVTRKEWKSESTTRAFGHSEFANHWNRRFSTMTRPRQIPK